MFGSCSLSIDYSHKFLFMFAFAAGVKQNFETRWIGWAGVHVHDEKGRISLRDSLASKVWSFFTVIGLDLIVMFFCWCYVFFLEIGISQYSQYPSFLFRRNPEIQLLLNLVIILSIVLSGVCPSVSR